MNENTDIHKEGKEKKKRKEVFGKGSVGKGLRLDSSYHSGDFVLQNGSPGRSAALNCRWKDITVERGENVFLYSVLRWLHAEYCFWYRAISTRKSGTN